MELERLALVLRPRSVWEGCDLGVRLMQASWRPVFANYLAVCAPLFVVCCALTPAAGWLPPLLIWMAKPWLDRTILFALSRAVFGERIGFADLWAARGHVWFSQSLQTFTLRRLSASRSFSQPIHQLEGSHGIERRVRLRQLTARHRGVARWMTQMFAIAEFSVFASLLSLQAWLAPQGAIDWNHFLSHPGPFELYLSTLAYALAVAVVEPFYVAAGFGMYLNRRVELEAWDIEQEFRRVFPASDARAA